MAVLDRPTFAEATRTTSDVAASSGTETLRCIVCRQPFNFSTGPAAVVLKHIAYGYDFAHEGSCVETALSWIFVEPGYDRPAFSADSERVRVLRIANADGWAAVLPTAAEMVLAGSPVTFDELLCWALVEHGDGSRHLEGIVRGADFATEPGGAEFPEARRGRQASLGYVHAEGRTDPLRLAAWESAIRARYRAARH